MPKLWSNSNSFLCERKATIYLNAKKDVKLHKQFSNFSSRVFWFSLQNQRHTKSEKSNDMESLFAGKTNHHVSSHEKFLPALLEMWVPFSDTKRKNLTGHSWAIGLFTTALSAHQRAGSTSAGWNRAGCKRLTPLLYQFLSDFSSHVCASISVQQEHDRKPAVTFYSLKLIVNYSKNDFVQNFWMTTGILTNTFGLKKGDFL